MRCLLPSEDACDGAREGPRSPMSSAREQLDSGVCLCRFCLPVHLPTLSVYAQIYCVYCNVSVYTRVIVRVHVS